jgi:hypothetical protein
VEGTHEGLDAAREREARLGRPPALTPEQVRQARDLLAHPGNVDPPVGDDRIAQRGRVAVTGQDPHAVRRAHRPGVDRAGQPQQITPVPGDPGRVDPPADQRGQRPVVGGRVGPPKPLVGEVGQAGA